MQAGCGKTAENANAGKKAGADRARSSGFRSEKYHLDKKIIPSYRDQATMSRVFHTGSVGLLRNTDFYPLDFFSMALDMHSMTVPVFVRALKILSGLLEK
jgi:hypothetical protein